MRVLLISQFYPPTLGGVEVHVHALAHGLARRGHEVAVATLASEGLPAEGSEAGVVVHRLQGSAQRFGALHSTERRHAPPVPDPETFLGLRRIVDSFAPDIVHAHNWMGRSFVPLKERSRGPRYVVTLHDCGRTCAQGRMTYRDERLCPGPSPARCLGCARTHYGAVKGTLTLAGNALMRLPESLAVDLYLPVSAAIAEANALGSSRVRYEVVPNFAEETPLPAEDDPRLARLPSEPFILQVGDVVPDKGVGVLLDAYSRLTCPPPLVLVGRDERGAVGERPEGVTVTGRWPHELVAEAWRRSLLGTMPSLCLDASPTVTLEAMAARRPVVASALGGLVDQVVDGETGLLVPPGDAAALAAALDRLVADSALRQRMGEAARRRFDEVFRADVVIDRIEALYRSVLPASSASGSPSAGTRSATTGR